MEEKLTAQQWAAMAANANAEALVKRNKELLTDLVQQLDSTARRVDGESEKSHWRKSFASAAIASGKTPDEAILVADAMIRKLF